MAQVLACRQVRRVKRQPPRRLDNVVGVDCQRLVVKVPGEVRRVLQERIVQNAEQMQQPLEQKVDKHQLQDAQDDPVAIAAHIRRRRLFLKKKKKKKKEGKKKEGRNEEGRKKEKKRKK